MTLPWSKPMSFYVISSVSFHLAHVVSVQADIHYTIRVWKDSGSTVFARDVAPRAGVEK